MKKLFIIKNSRNKKCEVKQIEVSKQLSNPTLESIKSIKRAIKGENYIIYPVEAIFNLHRNNLPKTLRDLAFSLEK